MKSYKERTLIAWEELAWKYRNPKGQDFFTPYTCSTCRIYHISTRINKCAGCPMGRNPSQFVSRMGCLDFRTYKNASTSCHSMVPEAQHLRAFKARAEFFEKTLPMLKEVPARYFTPSRWTLEAFAFLDRSW